MHPAIIAYSIRIFGKYMATYDTFGREDNVNKVHQVSFHGKDGLLPTPILITGFVKDSFIICSSGLSCR